MSCKKARGGFFENEYTSRREYETRTGIDINVFEDTQANRDLYGTDDSSYEYNGIQSAGYDMSSLTRGGCFTCGKGKKNLNDVFKTLSALMPKYFKAYQKYVSLKSVGKQGMQVMQVMQNIKGLISKNIKKNIAKKNKKSTSASSPSKSKSSPSKSRSNTKKGIRGGFGWFSSDCDKCNQTKYDTLKTAYTEDVLNTKDLGTDQAQKPFSIFTVDELTPMSSPFMRV